MSKNPFNSIVILEFFQIPKDMMHKESLLSSNYTYRLNVQLNFSSALSVKYLLLSSLILWFLSNFPIGTAWKVSRIRSFFWSVFSCIRTKYREIVVSLRIQSECGKRRTRKTPNTDTFHAVRIDSVFNLTRLMMIYIDNK